MTPDGYDCEPLAVAIERAGVAVAVDTSERLTSLPAGSALRPSAAWPGPTAIATTSTPGSA